MKNVDGVVVHTVENSKWVANHGCNTDMRSLSYPWRCFGVSPDTGDYSEQLAADCFCDERAGVSRVVGRDLVEVSE
jgi:hypothetical protein